MDFLKGQFERIRAQLAGLNASQKMLAAALVAIMVMVLVYWSSYAGKSDMVTLDLPLAGEDMAMVTGFLAARNIPYDVAGDRLRIPADRQTEIMGALQWQGLLPRDTRSAFDDIVKNANPFMPNTQYEALRNQARNVTLAQVIRTFPRVSAATVIVDTTHERGMGGTEPSATVHVSMKRGEQPDAKLVQAAADLVSGAVANLSPAKVKVIVDGVSQRVRGADPLSASADEWLANVQRAERYYGDKVSHHLSMIEGAMVSVSVQPNNTRKETVKHEVDPKNVIQKATGEDTNKESNDTASRGGGEPGVVTNSAIVAGAADGAAAGDVNKTESERNKTEFKVDFGTRDEKSFNPGGDAIATGVSVLIPRSYYAQVYKRRMNLSDKEPDEAVLSPFIEQELKKLKPTVKLAVNIKEDDAVHIDTYTDLMPLAGSGASGPAAAGTPMTLMVTDHVKEIAIGLLALVSLFMVSTMVKKGTPAPVTVPVPVEKAAPQRLGGGEETVGEVGEGAAPLDGMELDEDSVKAQQMLGQVSTLVTENPDAAAALVKRWLNRS